MTEVKIRPFLKWAGGKYQLLPQLQQHLQSGYCLLEPFVGAGAVFLNTDFKRYQLNDANPDLISVYQILQTAGQQFIDEVASLFKRKTNTPTFYYAARDKFNSLAPGAEKAALFIYLNRHGYNGLCRYNNSGKYNVPFGRYKQPHLPHESMVAFYEKSQQATFTCKHFAKVMTRLGKRTVVYCDPPYVPLSATAHFTRYSPLAFGESEQMSLAEHAQKLHRNGNKVILSNHDTVLTRQLYRGAEVTSFEVRRYISCKTTQRRPVRELIAVYPGK